MPLSFDAALGIHPKTLQLRTQRAEVLAHNIANADTPGYKAKDIDFAAFLESHQTDTTDMKRTHATHQRALFDEFARSDIRYRIPSHPSLDVNTVDTHEEKSAYVENALRFQASFRFLNGKFTGLITALKGE